MMRRLVATAGLFTLGQVSMAQMGDLMLYTSPLQLIDVFSRPMITLGVEQRMGSWGLCVEGGVKYIDIPKTDTVWIPSEGYTLRGEVKRYDLFGLGPNVYFSAEYRWILDRSTCWVFYSIEPEDGSELHNAEMYTDEFGAIQRVQVANLKIGKLLYTGKHVYWDFYTGLGFRWRDVSNTHREYGSDPRHVMMMQHPGPWLWHLEDQGDPTMLNFSLGFKFGWRF